MKDQSFKESILKVRTYGVDLVGQSQPLPCWVRYLFNRDFYQPDSGFIVKMHLALAMGSEKSILEFELVRNNLSF